MTEAEKVQFWERKILAWEQARYDEQSDDLSWLERIVKKNSSSVRYRLALAADILRPHLPDKTLLDIGCGSGLLFRQLANGKMARFIGIDVAQSAIDNARKFAAKYGYADRSTFKVGNIANVELPPFDIVVALGLLDWLNKEEIDILFSKIRGKQFLLSISEYCNSFHQILHRFYVFLAYGCNNSSFVPTYYSVAEIIRLLERHSFVNPSIYRDRRLSFCVFLHNISQ